MKAWTGQLRRDWKRVLQKLWKRLYWFGIVAFLSYLVSTRFSSIVSGDPTNMDAIIFIIWAALILIPLFREVNVFGVGLRNEIDSLRNDLRGEMLNLRSEIQNTINFRQEITVGHVPSDIELKATKEQIRPELERTREELNMKESALPTKEEEVPRDTQFLFAVRYAIENEVKRIWSIVAKEAGLAEDYESSPSRQFPRTTHRIVSFLSDRGVIEYKYRNLIQDIHSICSSAIHGYDVTETKVRFVREFGPFIITYLRRIKSSDDWPSPPG